MDNALRLSETSEIIESMIHDEYFWYSLQAFLIAVGNISKLLWPSPPRRGTRRIISDRGEKLRESLDVPEGSYLESRRLRNHFEHFDERLETWAYMATAHSMVDWNLLNSDLLSEDTSNNVFRNYDPERKIVFFQQDRYELQPILDEVEELLQKASVETKKPY